MITLSNNQITIKHKLDENPDLSYLEQDFKEDKSITEKERQKMVKQNKERLDAYNNGQWCAIGIFARANIEIPLPRDESGNRIIQEIRSGGLWGIESDSPREYIEEIEKEQVEELKDILKSLGVKVPKNVNVIKKESL